MVQHGMSFIDINAPGDYEVFLRDAEIPSGEGTVLAVGYYFDCFPVGVIVSELFDDCAGITWFFVDKAFRSKGIGKRFFNTFLDALKNAGIKEVELHLPREQAGLNELYSIVEQSGFERIDDGLVTYSFTLKDVCDGPLNPTKKRRTMGTFCARDIYEKHILDFYNRLNNREDLDIKPIFNEDILPESIFIMKKNVLSGCICLTKRGDAIEVSYLYDDGNPMILPALVTGTVIELGKIYPSDTLIYAATDKATVKGIIHDITRGKAAITQVTDHYTKQL